MSGLRIFITLLIALLSSSAYAQEYPCSIEYKRLRGTIKGAQAIIDLTFQDGQINGQCTFPELITENDQFGGHTYTERLEGNIDEHGVAILAAYTGNTRSGTYTGVLKENFQGTFRADGGRADGSFHLTEKYAEGDLAFEGYCLSMDSVLLDTLDSPMAHLDLKLLLPMKHAKLAKLKAAILKLYLGKEMERQVPDDSILYYVGMAYFERYVNANRDIFDGGTSFNWEIINSCYISLNHSGLLVYRTDSYAYTGGAHGMGVSRFLVFDTREMRTITLPDIFIPEFANSLSNLLEKKFRNMNYLDEEQSLKDAGLFNDHIPPSENFYINDNGIGFYYNPYKIAPYAMGSQLISLTWKELETVLKTDSPIIFMMKNRHK